MSRGRINRVYIILDIGKNMWGRPIETAVKVIRALIDNLKADPYDLESTWISFLTVSSDVEIIMSLSEITRIKDIKVNLYNGLADTNKINRFMTDLFNGDLIKSSPTIKGDWYPNVIYFSNGAHKDFENMINERDSLWGEWGRIFMAIFDTSKDNIDIEYQAYLLYELVSLSHLTREYEHPLLQGEFPNIIRQFSFPITSN